MCLASLVSRIVQWVPFRIYRTLLTATKVVTYDPELIKVHLYVSSFYCMMWLCGHPCAGNACDSIRIVWERCRRCFGRLVALTDQWEGPEFCGQMESLLGSGVFNADGMLCELWIGDFLVTITCRRDVEVSGDPSYSPVPINQYTGSTGQWQDRSLPENVLVTSTFMTGTATRLSRQRRVDWDKVTPLNSK